MLTHAGPKRRAKLPEEALAELVDGKLTKFDPQAVDLCIGIVTRLAAEVPDIDDYLAQPAESSPLVAARRSIGTC